jgi:hypothetical protein
LRPIRIVGGSQPEKRKWACRVEPAYFLMVENNSQLIFWRLKKLVADFLDVENSSLNLIFICRK